MYIVHAISKYSCIGAVHKVYTNEIQPMDGYINTDALFSSRKPSLLLAYFVKESNSAISVMKVIL